MKRAPPAAEGLWTEQVIADSTAEDLWPGATQRPGTETAHDKRSRSGGDHGAQLGDVDLGQETKHAKQNSSFLKKIIWCGTPHTSRARGLWPATPFRLNSKKY